MERGPRSRPPAVRSTPGVSRTPVRLQPARRPVPHVQRAVPTTHLQSQRSPNSDTKTHSPAAQGQQPQGTGHPLRAAWLPLAPPVCAGARPCPSLDWGRPSRVRTFARTRWCPPGGGEHGVRTPRLCPVRPGHGHSGHSVPTGPLAFGTPLALYTGSPAHLDLDRNARKAFLQNNQDHRTMPAPLHAPLLPPRRTDASSACRRKGQRETPTLQDACNTVTDTRFAGLLGRGLARHGAARPAPVSFWAMARIRAACLSLIRMLPRALLLLAFALSTTLA